MLNLILKQTNWGIVGSLFGFAIGFFVKIFIVDIVGLNEWGKYVSAQVFSSISETFLSLGIPFIIVKFFPNFIQNDYKKAGRIANIFLKYSLLVGIAFLIIIFFNSERINSFLYSDIDNFSFILLLMSVHVPISMLFGVVISLYRSVLKIKEIVLYGTFISVTIRALLTFLIFQFTSDIKYFIIIEIFVQIIVLFILLFLFNKKVFSLFVKSKIHEVTKDSKIISYGKKMFFTSVVSFFSTQALSFIISIKLPMSSVGAYNILLTISAFSTFLLINLNKVFAPAISKLYSNNNLDELNDLYKDTTFLINLLSIPLVLIIVTFSDEILSLYSNEMLEYKNYLFFILVGRVISLAAGSSGILMIMTGLEKQNLYIQIFRALLLIFFSLFLVEKYGILIIVILYVASMLILNLTQLIFIYNFNKISPFSKPLFFLFLITFIFMNLAFFQEINFSMYHYFIVPIFLYIVFIILMFSSVKRIYLKIKS